MIDDLIKKNNFLIRDQQLGNIIRHDPLNLRYDPYNLSYRPFDPPGYLRDPLNPCPGQPGHLGPLGKPTGRW